MGCSASRSRTILTRPTEDEPSNSSSSHSPHSNSYSYNYSDSSSTPVSRTLSLPTPLVHHPPLRRGDTNHLVSLTSTTYGSLVLIDPTIPDPIAAIPNPSNTQDCPNSHTKSKTLTLGDPKDPSSPDSGINTWELMEDLDDFDFDIIESPKKSSLYGEMDLATGCFEKSCDAMDILKSFEIVEHSDSKPLWKHLSEESLLSKMDPIVASSYRKALSSRQLGYNKESQPTKESKPQPIRHMGFDVASPLLPSSQSYLKGTEDRIVLYYTSLRGIRKTYEDCCEVRMIFQGFRVFVDERDISMDSSYRKELQSALGGRTLSLPQVFIRGKYIGGADEIKQLHEAGELAKQLQGLPVKNSRYVCESCGDARFVPCLNCNGSRKVYEEEECKLRRCPECNENGLIRCPSCCS